jgi:hypothetical protein
MDGQEFEDIAPILEVFRRGNPLTRKHILKKIPDGVFQDTAVSNTFYQLFPGLDSGSKTLLLKKLPLAPAAAPKIAASIKTLTKNQLVTYLKFLQTNKLLNNASLRKQLNEARNDSTFNYNYIIEELLDE